MQDGTRRSGALAGIVERGHRVAAGALRLQLEGRRSARLAEDGEVPQHRVAVLQHDLVCPHRRRDAVHLEHPAGVPLAGVLADLAHVIAERQARELIVELTQGAGDIQRLESVRGLDGDRQGAEDRLRLAFHAHGDLGRGRSGRERKNEACNGHESNETSEHESVLPRGARYVEEAAGLLTRGSLPHRLPGPRARSGALRQWHLGGGATPLTAAGPSRNRTGFPHRAPCSDAEPIIARCRHPPFAPGPR